MGEDKIKKSISLIKASFLVWFFCLVAFFGIIGYVVGIKHKIFTEVSVGYGIALAGFFVLGVLSFSVGLIAITYKARNKSIKKKSTILAIIKIFFILGILPFFLIWNILQPIGWIKKIKSLGIKQYWKEFKFKYFILKFIGLIVISVTMLPMWVGGYYLPFFVAKEKLNLVEDSIGIAGTGSMYPTFPKGQEKDPKEQAKELVGTPGMMRYPSGTEIFGNKLFSYVIGRGDIVSFFNDKTKEITEKGTGNAAGFIKRIVALPGDTIELRDGIFYLNNTPQKEPYIAQARSTFGGQFLEECKPMTIPEGKLFVMGDNRRGSGDSRSELGLISYADIDHVIPLEKQDGELEKNWHDPSNDLDESNEVKLDVNSYVDLLNEKRKEAGLKTLKYQPKLEASAKLRGETIIKYNDFSFDADKSGYDMTKAMNDVNYSNIVYGEAPTQGYYEAEDLIENQFAFPESKSFLLNKEYQEVGVSIVKGNINECPTQVVVQHFAGYVPPNYKEADIVSWEEALKDLKKIQPSWKNSGSVEFYDNYKKDTKRINAIIAQRISHIKRIVSKMRANQWLNNEERGMMDMDKTLANEQSSLADKINKKIDNYVDKYF